MRDVWASVGKPEAGTQGRLADVEVGCGTGVLARAIAGREQGASVVGVDIAASLLDRARRLAADLPAVRFGEADARALPSADASARKSG